ncbi:m-AAA protease-interacting protein 1, mitochondrial [Stomoxys calcitrans]|uniref:Tim44-like domain-containing protein n=1 Tax=Stomoxys calcitrans TaxID=35570 RepID=A0A1I8Q9B8_STOCA|nr:m-AAA protease-interacting protein 1, mitochondrial [Stomoxys calcitrans]
MNIGLRNSKLIYAFSKAYIPHAQLRSLSLASINCGGGGAKVNEKPECVNNNGGGSVVGDHVKLWWSLNHRKYSNISSKETREKEERLNKDGGEDDNTPEPKGKRTLPRLMDFPEIMWPSLLNSMKNWIMVHFIIRPYMDREFNIRDFAVGAKKAMQVVSSKLMNGDFAHLTNLVSSDALNELKPVIQKLSMSQRRQLEVKESDIYLTFPYQIGIMFDEDNKDAQKRWVEITMVFHVLRGLREMRESGEEIPWNMGTMPEYQDKVFVCNYRFVKEFTKGNESDWTVNIVNHFKPIDLVNEMKRH